MDGKTIGYRVSYIHSSMTIYPYIMLAPDMCSECVHKATYELQEWQIL